MAIFGMTRVYFVMLIPIGGGLIGRWLDNMETERMSMFRDKSSLFYRELAPGEKPSWP